MRRDDVPHADFGGNAVDSEIQLVTAFAVIGLLAIIALMFYIPLKLNSRNNALPIRTVEAKVVAKRSDVSFIQYGGHHGDSNAFADTRYFVTFQSANVPSLPSKAGNTADFSGNAVYGI